MNKPSDEKLVPITGTVNEALRESVEAHRWQNRQTVADVVREAVTEWAEKRGYPVAPASVAAEPTTEPEPVAADTKSKK